MKLNTLPLLLIKATIIAALNTNEAYSKDYFDLLQLNDNDEFQWGLRENLNYQTSVKKSPNNDTALLDRLVKRQAENSQNPFLKNKSYGPCDLPSGYQGECRKIIHCRMPELNDNMWLLVSHMCIIEQRSVGLCCPKNFQSTGPQIVSREDDANEILRVVNRPEQRGCGITTKQFPRITGGRPAEPDEWPWMVAILRKGLPFVWCGGTLITDRLVLTAAHCISNYNKTDFTVRLGEYNIKILNETRARDFQISNWIPHLEFNTFTNENDIALIRLDRPTLFNTYIWPVCMPPLNEDWIDEMAITTGWGTQYFSGPRSDILMETVVPVWRNEDCRKAVIERIADTMLCAGFQEGGQDSCQGDSGGPLLAQLPNRRWVVIGIVSWGSSCGLPYSPGVYTRVNKFLHWVVENSDI